jgi:hypothetical protein
MWHHRSLLLLAALLLLTSGAPPQPPTKKWEGPWIHGLFSSIKSTIYYGPWQCSQLLMADCQRTCDLQGHKLMGCMWLADIKFDGQGHIPLLRLEAKAGTRYAMRHCCCDYPIISTEANRQRRGEWNRHRKSFRERWAKSMGRWPTDANGDPWDGHHVHDLYRGGSPTDGNNILPIPLDLHETLDKQYDLCYSGSGQWNAIGSDRPYID